MRRTLPACLFAALVVAVYADPVFTGRMFSGRDLVAYNHPMEKAIHDAYARGRLPVWTEEISGGRPLLPNPNAGALYPVRAALALVPFPAATRLFPVVHWILAGWGMLALSRALGASAGGAWVAAATYAFSGVGVGLVFFPNLQPGMAWLPWVVWAVARPGVSGGRRAVTLGLFLAMDFLAGDPFTIAMGLGAAALWLFVGEPASGRRRGFAALVAGIALACLAALPLLVAVVLWSAETSRAVLGLKLSQSFFYSIRPLRLLELLVPFPFGRTWALADSEVWGFAVFHTRTLGMMATLYAGAFAPLAVALTWRDRGSAARFSRWTLALALACAVLPSLLPPPLEGLPSPLPLRNPEKLAVLATFALALLAGPAFDRAAAGALARRWPLAVGGALAAAASFASLRPETAGSLAALLAGAPPELAGRAASQLPGALAGAGLAWMATLLACAVAAGPGRGARAAAVALLTAVPIAADRKIAQTFSEDEVLAPTAFARRVRRLDPAGRFRVVGESFLSHPSAVERAYAGADIAALEQTRRCLYYQTQSFWGLGTVLNHDFDVGDLSRVESLRRLALRAAGFSDSADFFSGLSLKWGARFKDQTALAGFRRVGGDFLQDWDENASALPDIRLAGRFREVPGGVEALEALPRLAPGEILLETGRSAGGASAPGAVRVLSRAPERLTLEVSAPEPSWLFVLRGYWSYRTVRMDGKPVEYVPAQLAYSAVAVPAGEHRIEWIEDVPGGRVSRAGPLLFLLVAAWLVVRERRAGPA
jgi:hypothetical protein